jgi:Domain of unknown function (DUF4129)
VTPIGNRPSVFARFFRSITFAVFTFLALLIPPGPTFAHGVQAPQSSAAQSGAYDAARFAAELRRLGAAIEKSNGNAKDIEAIQKVLPPSWEIATSEAHYEFSSVPLRELLECNKCDAAARKSRCAQAKSWANTIAFQVEGYSASDASGGGNSRAKLDEILKRREFGAVRPPSQWDLLRQRINAWIMHMLNRLFENIGRHPLGAKLLFWLILFAVVGWLAMMLVRFWLGRARMDELRSVGEVAFARSWQEWIRAAREAAARGDFRGAVHSVYWAGIAHLEDDGTISRDRTRTPRERLQLVAQAVAAAAAAPQILRQRDSLAALTSLFERVWYGRGHADARDFDASMKQAEGLGCDLQ